MNASNQPQTIALGLLGAAIGGCIGYFAFFWIARQGFYALALPPAFLGYGAWLCVRRRSTVLAAICAVAGLCLGLFTEWRFTRGSLSFFLTHLHYLTPITMIMLAFGTFLSFRLALGRETAPKE